MLKKIFTTDELVTIQENIFPIPASLTNLEHLQKEGFVIFGAGLYGKLSIESLAEHGLRPDWIVDNNAQLWGTHIHGIEIRSAASLELVERRYVLLTSGHCGSMFTNCKEHGVTNILLPRNIPVSDFVGNMMGCTWNEMQEYTALYDAYCLLSDDDSRRTLKNYIAYQLTLNNRYFSGYGPLDMYFPAGLSIDYSSFVDVGAFDGDTLQSWIKKTGFVATPKNYHYEAFEPGSQFSLLQNFVDALPPEQAHSIHLHNAAAGKESGNLILSPAQLCSEFYCQTHALTMQPAHTSDISVPVIRLDDALKNICPTIIKADIEGAELDMLEGAKKTLARCRPTLAISVYHKREDIWQIPLWIHRLNLGYKFYLRHHQSTYTDTVCYAIVK